CLLRANTRISVDAIDSSDAMLRQLTLRVDSNRVHTRTADARIFQPTRHDYDLIATHFFLDCLTSPQVSRLAIRMRNDSSPNALWVISEFAIPPNIYGRTIARPLISALYLAFGLLTGLKIRQLPNHRSALRQAGWYLV